MADPATGKNRLSAALTIRRRLVAFGVIAMLFAVGASYGSLAALQSSGAATAEATRLASFQRHQQDAINRMSNMRSDVLETILAHDGTVTRSPQELNADLRVAAEALSRDRDLIAELDPDNELRSRFPAVAAAEINFVNEATRLGALATEDPDAALAALEPFLSGADSLFADLKLTTAIIATRATAAADAAAEAEEGARRSIIITSAVGTGLILLLTAVVALSIARQLRQLSNIARTMAGGDLRVRNEIHSADELGGLARSFDEMADSFEDLVMRLEREAAQDAFRRRLFDAFDMAGDDTDVHAIVEEAMTLIGSGPMEVLLSDSSKHHVTQAVTHPISGAPNCPVGSTGQCVAVRRGHRLVFESSQAIDACPHLKRRDTPCSAVCVPITFNGESLGVIHATGPDGLAADPHTVDRLAALASQTGARLGTINAFQGARQQATIDGLTGLRNRRTLENDARTLGANGADYSLIMCDLDLFKNLNDHYGHEMGDRALRLFGQVLRDTTRESDIAARLGGEEFVIVQPGMTATDSVATVERIQLTLATRLEMRDDPPFTASFGLSDTTMAAGFDSVLQIADAGLLAAKDQGRDRWVVGDVLMASALSRRGRPRGIAPDLADTRHGPTVLPERI